MFAVDDPRILFVHNPKTAGLAIHYAFERAFSAFRGWHCRELQPNKHDACRMVAGVPIVFDHDTPLSIRGRIGHSAWCSYWTFSVVRNPWDRAVSLWWHVTRSVKSFRHAADCARMTDGEVEEVRLGVRARGFPWWLLHYPTTFCRWHGADTTLPDQRIDQMVWFMDGGGGVVSDVFRFEDLSEMAAKVHELFGVEVRLKRENSGGHTAYRDHYDHRSRKLVARWAEPVIARYGYEF